MIIKDVIRINKIEKIIKTIEKKAKPFEDAVSAIKLRDNKLFQIFLKLLLAVLSLGLLTTIIFLIIFKISEIPSFKILNIYPLGFPININWLINIPLMRFKTLLIIAVAIIGIYVLNKIYNSITKNKIETDLALKIMEVIITPIFNILIIVLGIIIGSNVEDTLMSMSLLIKLVWILWIYIAPILLTTLLNIKLLNFEVKSENSDL